MPLRRRAAAAATLSDVGFALIGTCQRRQLVISWESREEGGRDANDASDLMGSSLPCSPYLALVRPLFLWPAPLDASFFESRNSASVPLQMF